MKTEGGISPSAILGQQWLFPWDSEFSWPRPTALEILGWAPAACVHQALQGTPTQPKHESHWENMARVTTKAEGQQGCRGSAGFSKPLDRFKGRAAAGTPGAENAAVKAGGGS